MSEHNPEPQDLEQEDAAGARGTDDESLADDVTNAPDAPEVTEEAEAHWGP